MKTLLTGCGLAAVVIISLAAAQPAMPQPGPEQKNLAHFAGTWTMDGTLQDSPMGPGGPMKVTETCRMFEGGWHLVCESTGSGPMGSMKGMSVITYDRAAQQYRYFSVNNMPDAETATGTYANNAWTWTSKMPMGAGKTMSSRFVVTESSPTVHLYKWEVSEDGTKWTTMMEAKGTRTSK